jgi:hypothetical protein
MMLTVNRTQSASFRRRAGRFGCGVLLALPVLLAARADAGQASDSLRISIEYIPLGAGTCATVSDANGKPQVICRPRTPDGGTIDGLVARRYRLPDAHVKIAGPVVEEVEPSVQAWGEYSSRVVSAQGVDYVEMLVTW